MSEGEHVSCPLGSAQMVGQSAAFLAALRTALQVADSSASVLLCGESGTGKELLARAIHRHSPRALQPFIALNCAALPEHLLESELFGHEKGAFTGAGRRRLGRFERATGGTLFLDEIGDMSPSLQAKMLRALEEGEIERLGGESTVAVDVRVIAATNCQLEESIKEGKFREDLYYRLAVVVVHVPPLRERGDDIRLLAEHFLVRYACENRRPVPRLAPETLDRIYAYHWPGNVRELRNAMERALLVADGPEILPSHLPVDVQNGWGLNGAGAPAVSEGDASLMSLDDVERRHIRRVLDATGGHIGRAAEILGIHRNTLRRKMREHGLE